MESNLARGTLEVILKYQSPRMMKATKSEALNSPPHGWKIPCSLQLILKHFFFQEPKHNTARHF